MNNLSVFNLRILITVLLGGALYTIPCHSNVLAFNFLTLSMLQHLKIGKIEYDKLLVHVSTLTKAELEQNPLLAIRADVRAKRNMTGVRNLVWALFTVTRFCFPWLSEEDKNIWPGSSCGNAHKPGLSCHSYSLLVVPWGCYFHRWTA